MVMSEALILNTQLQVAVSGPSKASKTQLQVAISGPSNASNTNGHWAMPETIRPKKKKMFSEEVFMELFSDLEL